MSIIRKHTSLRDSVTKRPSISSLSSFEEPLNPSFVKSELDEARASLLSKTSTVADLEKERENLNSALQTALSELDNTKSTLEALKADLEATQAKAKDSENQLHEAQQSIESLQTEREKLQDALQMVCNELEAMREAVAAQEIVTDVIESRIRKSARDEIDALRAEHSRSLAAKEAKNAELSARVAELEAKMSRMTEDGGHGSDLQSQTLANLQRLQDGFSVSSAAMREAVQETQGREEMLQKVLEEQRALLTKLRLFDGAQGDLRGKPELEHGGGQQATAVNRTARSDLRMQIAAALTPLSAADACIIAFLVLLYALLLPFMLIFGENRGKHYCWAKANYLGF